MPVPRDTTPFRHRRRAGPLVLPLAWGLCGATAAIASGGAPVALPMWGAWITAVLAVALAVVTLRRPGVELDESGLTLRAGAQSERFGLREIARVEMAHWAKKTDIHLVLRGGGVRRIPPKAIPSPEAFAQALGRQGILTVAI